MQITVPSLGESITEASIAKWYKNEGDFVEQDEILLELETDKITLEVNSPKSGRITKIEKEEGATVNVDELLAILDETDIDDGDVAEEISVAGDAGETKENIFAPSARKLSVENNISADEIEPTGKGGRIIKENVLDAIKNKFSHHKKEEPKKTAPKISKAPKIVKEIALPKGERSENRVRMSKLRLTIAKRLKESQNNAAILTTFNEIDMSAVMAMRSEYKDVFAEKHDVRLGFMSFFVKAVTTALQEFPDVNASIDGDEVVYKNYCDIGVAVGTPQGLVVPVVRNAERLSFAEIEGAINELAQKAVAGNISMSDMTGGTFTISNGGVYGSLMSTPIINPPQSGILGMHKIEKRAVVVNDEIVIRPMMYLALSYDHRIVDGKDSVSFLVKVKELLEDPRRLLLGV